VLKEEKLGRPGNKFESHNELNLPKNTRVVDSFDGIL
jgi:hypothetical protein